MDGIHSENSILIYLFETSEAYWFILAIGYIPWNISLHKEKLLIYI